MVFPTKGDVLAIHARAIAEFGGSPGVRDDGALESALIAAQNLEYYASADLVACAAAYAFHLSQAHAFIDGNKRMAAIVTEAFLLVNGARLDADDDELFELFMGIAASELDRDEVERWLRARVVAQKPVGSAQ